MEPIWNIKWIHIKTIDLLYYNSLIQSETVAFWFKPIFLYLNVWYPLIQWLSLTQPQILGIKTEKLRLIAV